MLNMNKILDEAIKKDASDIHLIYGLKPMLRIARELIPAESVDELQESDLYEAYDFFIRGNVEKDEIYKEFKKLDTSYKYENIRLRVNVSSSDDFPLFTMRLIKNELPSWQRQKVSLLIVSCAI